MLMDRSTKLLIAIASLVASTFLTMKHIITEDPIDKWLLAGLLFLLSVVFWIWIWLEDQEEEEETSLTLSQASQTPVTPQPQEWIISKDVSVAEKAVEQASQAVATETAKAKPDPEPEVEAESPAEETPVSEESVTKAEAVDDIVENGDDAEVVEEAKAGESPAEDVVAEAMSAPANAEDTEEAEEESPAEEVPVAEVEASDSDEPDDLTRVEGIGPKYSEALIDGGVTTFAQLAASSMEALEKIISDADMRRPSSIETWAEQAELAAKGDWDGLQKLQDTLDGGRRT